MRSRLWCVLSLLFLLIAWPAGSPAPAFADGPASETSATLVPQVLALALDQALVSGGELSAEAIQPPTILDTPDISEVQTQPDTTESLPEITATEPEELIATGSIQASSLDAASSCTPLFPTVPPDNVANEQAIADNINLERARRDLAPLILTAELTQSSRRHSRDMADNNNQSHYGSDGSQPNQRITWACYQGSPGGEIIVWGYGNVSEVVGWWMNSPVHRAMILNPRFRDFGVGYASNPYSYYKFAWTVNFGAGY